MSAALTFTGHYRVDRIVALGVLALRPLRHVAIGRAPSGPPIEGLRVEAAGAAERSIWHESTGLYGFLRLPPGPHRLLVTDPSARFQPAAFAVMVPNRSAVRQRLEAGIEQPDMSPRPLVREVQMHVSPAAPLVTGTTAVWGLVRNALSQPVALARLMLTTIIEGAEHQHVTWTAPDGSYALRLPGERPDTIGDDPPWRVTRLLVVHTPRAPLAAALAADFLAALPDDRDALDPDAPGAAFERSAFALRDSHGVPRVGAPGNNPTLPILGGQQARWDIELA